MKLDVVRASRCAPQPLTSWCALQPAMLSANLADLNMLLRSEGVKAHSHLFDTNAESLKTLLHFLKKYAKGLSADTPLRAQRHKLEFVLPCGPPRPRAP